MQKQSDTYNIVRQARLTQLSHYFDMGCWGLLTILALENMK